MTEKKGVDISDRLEELVVRGMLEKKAQEITILDLTKVSNAVASFFIICSGSSDTQLEAVMESVEDEVYENTEMRPWQREGKSGKEWILLDYGDVVVHIFKKDRRAFYALEELWGDAKIIKVNNGNEK